jgi:predicted nucleic acid-binding protein
LSLVLDASFVVEYLLRPTRALHQTIAPFGSDMHVPALCDVEFVSVLRRLAKSGAPILRIQTALAHYFALPIKRHGHERLMPRMLDLRDNFNAYDATYVALAEALGATVATADEKLATAITTYLRLPVLQA